MIMLRYILKGKIPVAVEDLFEWGEWMETADRRVAHEIINDVKISTVFLGLDHNFIPDGDPLIFETMIFRDGQGDDTWRYSTWDDAVTGHANAVAIVKREQIKIVNGN